MPDDRSGDANSRGRANASASTTSSSGRSVRIHNECGIPTTKPTQAPTIHKAPAVATTIANANRTSHLGPQTDCRQQLTSNASSISTTPRLLQRCPPSPAGSTRTSQAGRAVSVARWQIRWPRLGRFVSGYGQFLVALSSTSSGVPFPDRLTAYSSELSPMVRGMVRRSLTLRLVGLASCLATGPVRVRHSGPKEALAPLFGAARALTR